MAAEADGDRPPGWSRVRRLLAEALERPSAERRSFLHRACGDDQALRHRVEALLHHEGRGDLLARAPLPEALLTEPEILDEDAADGDDATLPRLGRYRLLRKLGDGGMGTVYLARREDAPDDDSSDTDEPPEVAVKILKPGLDTGELIARFHAERRILAQLRHPYLVQLLDAGTTGGDDGSADPDGGSGFAGSRPYFVMEYVDGEPIDVYCRRRGLSVEARLELFRKVCAAVHFAHRNLVLHCDLKPANLLVTADGTPKLLDFGVAKLLHRDPDVARTLTRLGLRPVTPRYASPEQVEGEPVSTASDVYSLGVVLYELLTGRRPYRFDTWDPRHVARVIRERTPTRPSLAVRGDDETPPLGDRERWSRRLRGDLDVLVLRALAKDPRERFDSVDQMAEEIGRHLRGLPIRSRPDSWLYRGGKFVRRHAAAVVAAGLVLALLLSLLGLLAVERQQARRQAVAARQAQAEAEEVAQFLVDLFETSHAAGDGGGRPTALELLEAGAGQLARERSRTPSSRARLLDALGRAHLKLGSYDRAEPLLEEALELRREAFGDRHPEVARSLRTLARLAERRGKLEEAERLYRRTLEMRQELLGPEHPEVAESLADLGRLALGPPRREEALALLTRSVGILERSVRDRSAGPPTDRSADPRLRLAYSADGLGFALQISGRPAAAEHRFLQALALRQEVLGPEHPRVAESLLSLGWLYRRMGRSTEAAVVYRRAAAIQRRTLGPDHPRFAQSLHSLGVILAEAFHRYDEAERLLRRALAIDRAALGPDHLDVATHQDTLANVLVNEGRFAESVDLYRRSTAIRKKVLGADHFTVGLSYTNVAHSLRLQGRCDEAEPWIERARRVIETALGADDFWAAAPLHELAACRRDQGRWAESERLFRRSLDILEAQGVGPTHPVWREVATDYTELLRDMKKPSEARSLERRLADASRAPA
jgi:serine/threonine protein kinase/tetratricopeptide (TPR) repeat protein